MSAESEQSVLVPCISCGYDLRGLDDSGMCPECGMPVGRSLAGHELRYASPSWLRTITRGQRCVAIGWQLAVLGLLTSVFLLSIASVLLRLVLNIPNAQPVIDVLRSVIGFIVLSGIVLATGGVFLLTTQDPRESLREAGLSARTMARFGLGTAMVLVAAGKVNEFMAVPPLLNTACEVASLLGLLALTVGLVATLRWLALLAARIPDPALERSARSAAVFFRWSLPVLVASGAYFKFVNNSPNQPKWLDALTDIIEGLLGCGGLIIALLMFIQLLSLLMMMDRYRKALDRCFVQALEHESG